MHILRKGAYSAGGAQYVDRNPPFDRKGIVGRSHGINKIRLPVIHPHYGPCHLIGIQDSQSEFWHHVTTHVWSTTRATAKCGRANNLVRYNLSLLKKRNGIKMSGGAVPSKKPKT